MIDLPIGKAIIAVLSDVQCNDECNDEDYHCPINCCEGCEMENNTDLGGKEVEQDPCVFCCIPVMRRDGKRVHFKVVDYPFK